MKIVIASVILLCSALPAAAQRRAQPFAAPDVVADTTTHRPARPLRIAVRTGTGLAGLTIGGAAGLALGGLFVRRASRDNTDDLAGVGELTLSTLAGGAAGIGLGAGLPRLGARCSGLRRVTGGFLGAVVGASVVGYAGAVLDGGEGTRFESIGFLGGAGLGAAVGADC